MASKSKSRPASRRATEFQPQDLIFAGIGAVSLGRKEALRLYAKAGPAARLAAAYARDAQEQALIAANDAQDKVREIAAKAESAAFKQFGPVLAKLGIKPKKVASKSRARKKAPVRRRRAA
jgi:hypothetical protein